MNKELIIELDDKINSLNNENSDIATISSNKSINKLLEKIVNNDQFNFSILETLTISNMTKNVLINYIQNNEFIDSEDLDEEEASILDIADTGSFDPLSAYINEVKSIELLDPKIQFELLTKHEELYNKVKSYKKAIIKNYYDIICEVAEKRTKEVCKEYDNNIYKRFINHQLIILDNNFDNIINFSKEKLKLYLKKALLTSEYKPNEGTIKQSEIYLEKLSDEELNNIYNKYITLNEERINLRKYIASHNLALVVSIAKGYQNRGVDFLDLIQEGNFGLLRAIDRFDSSKGAALSTYATWWIRQSIARAIADKGRSIRLPVHFYDKFINYKTITSNYYKETGEYATDEYIMDKLNITKEELEEIKTADLFPKSLNDFIGEAEHGVQSELGDFIEDPTPGVEEQAIKSTIRDNLLEVLDEIPIKDKVILLMRFGIPVDTPFIYQNNDTLILLTSDYVNEANIMEYLMKNKFKNEIQKINSGQLILKYKILNGNDSTLDEVGKIFNVTRERIRQIEAKALRKLRHPARKKKLDYKDY